MAHHDEIDLTTLREVQRILETTDFATIDDLAAHGGPDGFAPLSNRQSSGGPLTRTDDLSPLPRRR